MSPLPTPRTGRSDETRLLDGAGKRQRSAPASSPPPQDLDELEQARQDEDETDIETDDLHTPLSAYPETLLRRSATPSPLLNLDIDQRLDADPATHSLGRRQIFISRLPATYKGIDAGPSPGTVVGILLGVVLGYVLVFWLIISLINSRNLTPQYVEGDDTEIVVRRGAHESSRRSKRSHRSRRAPSAPSEMSEAPPPPRSPKRRRSPARQRSERVIVEETIRRAESRPPPPPVSVREEIDVDIRESYRGGSRPPRRVDGDDEVEVLVEDSTTSASAVTPEPRRKPSGYRTVDPHGYGGGDYEYRSASRSRRG